MQVHGYSVKQLWFRKTNVVCWREAAPLRFYLSSRMGTLLHAPPMPAPEQMLDVKGLTDVLKKGRLKESQGGGQNVEDEPVGGTKTI